MFNRFSGQGYGKLSPPEAVDAELKPLVKQKEPLGTVEVCPLGAWVLRFSMV